ncbi:hypothetical protein [Jiella sp. M17.18]|uniref:hypothetical protein n=1 Tax=Jiella sp. M17.18 TaxID=3234247 RepID=UPI0034DEE696
MSASILSFTKRKFASTPLAPKMPWQNQDLAELYRVRDRLAAAGLAVDVDSGVSDEGDPWFIYQQAGTDNVVVHIARIDIEIHVVNCVTGNIYIGTSFREVSDRMLEDAPLALVRQIKSSSNVVLHPNAFLTAFVAAAIMLVDILESKHAEAAVSADADGGSSFHHEQHTDHGAMSSSLLTHEGGKRGGDGGAAELGTVSRRFQKDGIGQAWTNGHQSGGGSYSLSSVHALPCIDGPASVVGISLFAVELARMIQVDWHEEIRSSAPSSESMFVWGYVHNMRVGHSQTVLHGYALPNVAHPMIHEDTGAHLANMVQHGSVSLAPVVTVASSDDAIVTAPSKDNVTDNISKLAIHKFDNLAVSRPDETHASSDESHKPKEVDPSPHRTADGNTSSDKPGSAPVEATKADSSAASATTDHTTTGAQSTVKADGNAVDLPKLVEQFMASRDGASATLAGSSGATAHDEGHKNADATSGPDIVQNVNDTKGSDHDVVSQSTSHVSVDSASVVPDFTAGHVDVLCYHAGDTLSVEGFALGEDVLTFSDLSTASTYISHFSVEGEDIVLGDPAHGELRLVGVLRDMTGVHHPATAAA